VVAGLGGGVGTGVAPDVVDAARALDRPVEAVVVLPAPEAPRPVRRWAQLGRRALEARAPTRVVPPDALPGLLEAMAR